MLAIENNSKSKIEMILLLLNLSDHRVTKEWLEVVPLCHRLMRHFLVLVNSNVTHIQQRWVNRMDSTTPSSILIWHRVPEGQKWNYLPE